MLKKHIITSYIAIAYVCWANICSALILANHVQSKLLFLTSMQKVNIPKCIVLIARLTMHALISQRIAIQHTPNGVHKK